MHVRVRRLVGPKSGARGGSARPHFQIVQTVFRSGSASLVNDFSRKNARRSSTILTKTTKIDSRVIEPGTSRTTYPVTFFGPTRQLLDRRIISGNAYLESFKPPRGLYAAGYCFVCRTGRMLSANGFPDTSRRAGNIH